MGIKGLYDEIGPGKRVSLSKLAIEKFERTGQPFRLAIDASIWQFQVQSGKGGKNPALRTFFYRLLRLLSSAVQPLLVFDGPNKPPFKRGRRTVHNSTAVQDAQAKQLLTLLGIPYHDAPGEAEAECALLQQEGIVDAVLSEDVDALMFGCCLTLRNWSSEGTRGNKAPTHVSMYDAEDIRNGKSGLTAKGILLVALMNGGDYNPEGVTRCGIKLACQAARAGFGESLCQLAVSDVAGLRCWREKLYHEIRTNESGFFRTKHTKVVITDEFPNKEILSFYQNPAVSSPAQLGQLKLRLDWEAEADVVRLRRFVSQAFDWQYLLGTKKFVRVIAQSLLVRRLMRRENQFLFNNDQDTESAKRPELAGVTGICGKGSSFSGDGMPELRIAYVPLDVVGLDLTVEEHGPEGELDDKTEVGHEKASAAGSTEDESEHVDERVPRKRAKFTYDPRKPIKIWIGEPLVRAGLPLEVLRWEEEQRNALQAAKIKAAQKGRRAKGGMEYGALDRFVTATKRSIRPDQPQGPRDVPPFVEENSRQISSGLLSAAPGRNPLARRDTMLTTGIAAPGTSSKTKGPAKQNLRSIDHQNRLPYKRITKRAGVSAHKLATVDTGSPPSSSKGPPESLNIPSPPYVRGSALGSSRPAEKERRSGHSFSDDLPEDIWTSQTRPVHSTNQSKEKASDRAGSTNNARGPDSSLAANKSTGRSPNRSMSHGKEDALPSPRKKNRSKKGHSHDQQSINQDLSNPTLSPNHPNPPTKNPKHSPPTSQPLPPYPNLIPPNANNPTVITISSSTSPEPSSPEKPQPQPHPKRTVMLQDSLEGAWRETDDLSLLASGGATQAWRGVEVVDLTASGPG